LNSELFLAIELFKAINEARRILKEICEIIIAFINKDSKLGQIVDKEKITANF
jgi:hypothetical protein